MSEGDRDIDLYYMEHPEQHTRKCLEYAVRIDRRFCIVECADQRIPPGTQGRPVIPGNSP